MKNPYFNALGASLYIGVVGTFMHLMEKGYANTPDKWFSGIAFISLLTLSVATMGYFFVFVPLQMYLDGQKQESVRFFLKTLATFALITLVIFFFLFR
ncbi:MAG TPA: hypothetical protein PLD99_01740 [Parcubacteria group bacterium]|nr:hypothetical protein [Parcubacteria group bacterium]